MSREKKTNNDIITQRLSLFYHLLLPGLIFLTDGLHLLQRGLGVWTVAELDVVFGVSLDGNLHVLIWSSYPVRGLKLSNCSSPSLSSDLPLSSWMYQESLVTACLIKTNVEFRVHDLRWFYPGAVICTKPDLGSEMRWRLFGFPVHHRERRTVSKTYLNDMRCLWYHCNTKKAQKWWSLLNPSSVHVCE